MRFKVVLVRSEEGVSASVPGLPGCWSQGSDDEDALENIRTAIHEYLAVVDEQTRGADVREVEVVNAFTMGGIVVDAGLTIEEFRKLL